MGLRDHDDLIQLLEDQLWRESNTVVADSKSELVDYALEVYIKLEIGLEK